MVAFRVGELQVATLDDGAFATVLAVAAQAGGASAYPTLCGLTESSGEIDPLALVDELARLASTDGGSRIAMLIAALRDDLMEALSAAEEG